jgi:pimeloyl-ACP methyl ester carboxylesterase
MASKHHVATLLSSSWCRKITLFYTLFSVVSSQSSPCETSMAITRWVLEQAYNNTAAGELLGEAAAQYAASQPSSLDLIQILPQVPWAAFQAQAVLGGASVGASEPGEVFYVLNTLNSSSLLGNLSKYDENAVGVFDVWRDAWVDMANSLVERASRSEIDDELKASLFYRASQYYFVSQWPFPVSDKGLQAAKNSTIAFDKYLSYLGQTRGYYVQRIDIPFNNGTVDVNLPGIFISPDPSQKMPVVILNTGTDYPKEAIFPFGGSQSLINGYSVLIFDGPGQGAIKRAPPYMPLVPQWGNVIDSVLSSLANDSNVSKYVSMDDVVVWGVSLGGYLAGQACSTLPKEKVSACVVTPAVMSMVPPYTDRLIQTLFVPLAGLNSSDIPEGYVDALQDESAVLDKVLKPLLLECGPQSGASELWFEMFSAPQSELISSLPDYVYNVMDYAGVFTSNVTDIISATYLGYQNVLNFTNTNISNSEIPILILSGTEDNLMGGQAEIYFDQLPLEVQGASKLVNLTAKTGAALHSQAGALATQSEQVFPWLKQTLGTVSPQAPSSNAMEVTRGFITAAMLFLMVLPHEVGA